MKTDVKKYLKGEPMTADARAQIPLAEAYVAITELESSGTPLVVPLKGVLETLLQMAHDRSNVHGTGCGGWLGEMVWIANGDAPIPAVVQEYSETRTTRSIMVRYGIGTAARLQQLELEDLGRTFFRTPGQALEAGKREEGQ